MVETDDVAFGWSGKGEEEEEECEGKVDYCHVALYCVVIGEIRLQKCIILCSLDNPKRHPNTWHSSCTMIGSFKIAICRQCSNSLIFSRKWLFI